MPWNFTVQKGASLMAILTALSLGVPKSTSADNKFKEKHKSATIADRLRLFV